MDSSAHLLVLPQSHALVQRLRSVVPGIGGGAALPDVRGLIREARTFGLIGIANAVVDTLLFTVLHAGAGIGPLSAKIVSGLITIVASYYANRRWTWPPRGGRGQQRQRLLQFSAISFGGLILAEGCLGISHYVLGLPSLLADNLAANVVGLGLGTVWRFMASRRWVFTAGKEGTPVTARSGRDWPPTAPIDLVPLNELLRLAEQPTARIR